MPVKSFKLGPGVLTLGEAGTALSIEAQIANARVDWSENVSSTDDLDLLNGETLAGDENATYRATLAGNLVQDITTGGVVEWSWLNKGTEQAVRFVPSTAEGREVVGVIVPVPLTLGGDVKTRNRSDFTWRFVGDPELGDVAP